jgi:glyoxylase-like metal-dependent hydrolase (beta-lactamase superfamily II)
MPVKEITAAAANDGALVPPAKGVAVRMYNTGFGDCFLLAFRSEAGEARYVLIDCGVHQKWKGGKERLMLVASDIAKATNNHLHVVAVTHEHTDHVSGFLQGESAFGRMKIDDLWLAWTENPGDPAARLGRDHAGGVGRFPLFDPIVFGCGVPGLVHQRAESGECAHSHLLQSDAGVRHHFRLDHP